MNLPSWGPANASFGDQAELEKAIDKAMIEVEQERQAFRVVRIPADDASQDLMQEIIAMQASQKIFGKT